jgi:hypothetical protein
VQQKQAAGAGAEQPVGAGLGRALPPPTEHRRVGLGRRLAQLYVFEALAHQAREALAQGGVRERLGQAHGGGLLDLGLLPDLAVQRLGDALELVMRRVESASESDHDSTSDRASTGESANESDRDSASDVESSSAGVGAGDRARDRAGDNASPSDRASDSTGTGTSTEASPRQ